MEEKRRSRRERGRPLGTVGLLAGLGGAVLVLAIGLFLILKGGEQGREGQDPVRLAEGEAYGDREGRAGGLGQERQEPPALGADRASAWGQEEYAAYQAYQDRYQKIVQQSQIEGAGFSIIQEQVFPLETQCFGPVTLIPALDEQHRRLALFFAGPDGSIVYRTEQLETNICRRGELDQCNEGIAAVSFQDVDEDGLTDIVLITLCRNGDRGEGAGEGGEGEVGDKPYKVGDVLFQSGEGFYRDWRLSDKLNRFSMNKSVRFILSFVKEGRSTEFLYRATTLEELIQGGLTIDQERRSWQDFEKLGRLEVVPGFYRMAEYNVLMIYLVNEQGYIVWSFQPMGEHENLYELKGVRCHDFDGDGLKDLAVLASYGYETETGEMAIDKDYSIYYQRTGGFLTDTEVKSWYPCGEETDMERLLEQAGLFWGWS